ncbi:MAG: protein kinase [Candidatus Riflebacteria bacterium]|nr:protein kinase [Candidatus Riflebacteria bacterium]
MVSNTDDPSQTVDAASGFSESFRQRFEIRSVLGRGGMGTVYLAHHKGFDLPVAIKFAHLTDCEIRARFARECQILARLRHPAILQVYDCGEESGLPFVVMEVVEGRTLREHIERSRSLAPAEVARIGCTIVEGLAHAHGRSVIHRDLKSENVLIDPGGRVKICDFGLAVDRSVQSCMTAAGMIMGTPGYMAPEIVQGESATARSDQYALGCILFEMLAGRLPFPAATDDGSPRQLTAVLADHVSTPVPPLSDLAVQVPADLEEIVRRCLAKQPSLRFETVTAVGQALEAVARGLPREVRRIDAAPPTPAKVAVTRPAMAARPSPRRDTRTRSPMLKAPLPTAIRPRGSTGSRRYLAAFAAVAVLAAAVCWIGLRAVGDPGRPIAPSSAPGGPSPAGTMQMSEIVGMFGGFTHRVPPSRAIELLAQLSPEALTDLGKSADRLRALTHAGFATMDRSNRQHLMAALAVLMRLGGDHRTRA